MPCHSTDLLAAEAIAAEVELKLTIYDFRYDQYVYVVTDEGFVATIPSAFVLRWKKWFFIFAEHHDTLIFDKSEVLQIFEYKITKRQDAIHDISKFKPNRKGKKNVQKSV